MESIISLVTLNVGLSTSKSNFNNKDKDHTVRVRSRRRVSIRSLAGVVSIPFELEWVDSLYRVSLDSLLHSPATPGAPKGPPPTHKLNSLFIASKQFAQFGIEGRGTKQISLRENTL